MLLQLLFCKKINRYVIISYSFLTDKKTVSYQNWALTVNGMYQKKVFDNGKPLAKFCFTGKAITDNEKGLRDALLSMNPMIQQFLCFFHLCAAWWTRAGKLSLRSARLCSITCKFMLQVSL
jgi:hypothetical protein